MVVSQILFVEPVDVVFVLILVLKGFVFILILVYPVLVDITILKGARSRKSENLRLIDFFLF